MGPEWPLNGSSSGRGLKSTAGVGSIVAWSAVGLRGWGRGCRAVWACIGVALMGHGIMGVDERMHIQESGLW